MITFHFHLQLQYKYELFHINFTWFHCTGRYELDKLTLLPVCGFIAQLVEHRTGIAEVMGSNPVEALIFFFRLLLSNCLNWKIYCDDHISLSSTTAVQIWIISYIFHMISLHGKIWTQQIDCAPNVCLHSSVGRASHRYRGGHGFESRWSSDFFFRLLLSNCLNWKIYCDDHISLSSTTAVQIWIISYIFHMISLHGKIGSQ